MRHMRGCIGLGAVHQSKTTFGWRSWIGAAALLASFGAGNAVAAETPKLVALAAPAGGPSCWQVNGWSGTSGAAGEQASLSSITCTNIPMTTGWVEVRLYYNLPPTEPLWLRIPLNDPHVTQWVFAPHLVFNGFDATGKPIVLTDVITGSGSDQEQLVAWPPSQGPPVAGARVRLRYKNSNECITNYQQQSGKKAIARACTNDPYQVYVLDSAGSGYFRLRAEQTGQCLYTLGDGQSVYSWGCWEDPGMRFTLAPSNGAYHLQNVSGQCLYDYGSDVYSWGCWNDPGFDYYIDLL